MPSFACRVMDLIGAEAGGVDFGSPVTMSVDEAPICQNLTDRFIDVEMREEEEENVRERMEPLCLRVSMGWGSGLVISHMWIVVSVVAAMSLPLGEKQHLSKW
jgi:hypothetical protein